MEACRSTSGITPIQTDLSSSVSLLISQACAYLRCQLSDIANGLHYFHSCNVIHGDLKGVRDRVKSQFTIVLTANQVNVLVDGSGHARIADFGLAKVTYNPESVLVTTDQSNNTPRWTAPEVLRGERCTREADIFSFAMVMIEVGRRLSAGWNFGLLSLRTIKGFHWGGPVQ